ncbi:MAG: tetratricopeptide repeat protein [Gammaproteobacteria bacterium]
MGLFTELKRRNVFRVAAAYAAVAWLSLELLSIVLPEFGAPAWALRALIIVLVVGFIPALIFAWAFEVTPDGIKREKHVDRSEPALQQSARKLDQVVIVLVVAAVGVLALDRFVLDPRAPRAPALATDRIDSIAVLPFQDFSAGGGHAYLGTGIADTILHSLTQLPGLKVAARTSSFQLAEQKADIAAIGAALGVGAVLEGSVQVVGNQLRIIAQLVRTSDQAHIWSRTFDGSTEDIFATQDTIAAEVAKSLRGDDAPALARQHRTSSEVFELVAKGRDLWQQRNPLDLAEAVRALERAVELDPDYAPARSEFAAAIWFSSLYGGVDEATARPRAEAQIEHALRLDPKNAQAWSIRGLILSRGSQPAATIAAYERALELNPNDANTMIWLAQELVAAGLFNDSRRRIEQAFQLDPRNFYVRGRYASALAQTGEAANIRRALAIVDESLRLEPDNARALNDATEVENLVGDIVKSVRHAVTALELRPGSYNLMGHFIQTFAMAGDRETARAWGGHIDSLVPDRVPGGWAIVVADFELFLRFATTHLERHPEDMYALNNYAFALALNGRYDDAIKWTLRDLEVWRGQRYQGNPRGEELFDLQMLIWLYDETGDSERAAAMRAEMTPMYRQLVAQGRPPGINGMLMETGYHIAMGDHDAAVKALRERSTTNERLLFPVWAAFPWVKDFVPRDDVQQMLKEWSAEQRELAARLRAEAPREAYNPALLPD